MNLPFAADGLNDREQFTNSDSRGSLYRSAMAYSTEARNCRTQF